MSALSFDPGGPVPNGRWCEDLQSLPPRNKKVLLLCTRVDEMIRMRTELTENWRAPASAVV